MNINRPKLGVVNGRAINLPKPEYTQELEHLCASGEVGIEVLISKEGLVLESKAVFGDEILYDSAPKSGKTSHLSLGCSRFSDAVKRNSGLQFPLGENVCRCREKWVKRPSFSDPPSARVSKDTKISMRLGIEPFSGNVLAAKATSGHPRIDRRSKSRHWA